MGRESERYSLSQSAHCPSPSALWRLSADAPWIGQGGLADGAETARQTLTCGFWGLRAHPAPRPRRGPSRSEGHHGGRRVPRKASRSCGGDCSSRPPSSCSPPARSTRHQVTAEEAARLQRRHGEAYRCQIGQVRPLAGARELLAYLTPISDRDQWPDGDCRPDAGTPRNSFGCPSRDASPGGSCQTRSGPVRGGRRAARG
jgi:hypothetical protein